MPTDQDNDQTDTSVDPTASDNAASEESSEDLEKLKEELSQAKKREAAARKKMDETQKENKRLKKAVIDEEEEEEEEKDEQETKFVTKDELWERDNKQALELYSDDEYKEDVEAGVPREKALKYAKLRYETMDDSAKKERQVALSSSGNVDRSLPADDDIVLTKEQQDRGITVEMIKKNLARRKAMGLSG